MAHLEKCPEGHYYDPDKYKSCPYCAGGNFIIEPPELEEEYVFSPHLKEKGVLPRHWVEKVLCPQCNCEIKVGQKYCTNCGAAQESYVPTQVLEIDEDHVMIDYFPLKSFSCRECGKEWRWYRAQYCPECGSENIYSYF